MNCRSYTYNNKNARNKMTPLLHLLLIPISTKQDHIIKTCSLFQNSHACIYKLGPIWILSGRSGHQKCIFTKVSTMAINIDYRQQHM
jgi:hypothetical protein